MITQAELKRILEYYPLTGQFEWLVGPRTGYVAGGRSSGEYIVIRIGKDKATGNSGRLYRASRLAVLYMTGRMPAGEVDHINRIRTDDRWCNLRECSAEENRQNVGLLSTNTSGCKGVSWSTRYQNWNAVVVHKGIRYHNFFHTVDEADAWCRLIREQLAGKFANHG